VDLGKSQAVVTTRSMMLMSRPSQMSVVYLTQDLKIAFISPARDID
jgi:hypothetical protein